jgi:hypothetical protein
MGTPSLPDTNVNHDFQLEVREDAIREACGGEMSSHISLLSPTKRKTSLNVTPSIKVLTVLHILVVEDNLVNQKCAI